MKNIHFMYLTIFTPPPAENKGCASTPFGRSALRPKIWKLGLGEITNRFFLDRPSVAGFGG